MKILTVSDAALSGLKVLRFARFCDHRGFFSEHFRRSDLDACAELGSLREKPLVQANESFSKKGVIRGLHFQWNPYMGKLVRTLRGHMIDVVLDIRKGSPTYGKAICYDMPTSIENDYDEWFWVPPGFAHGNVFLEETSIEYFCTGEYSQGFEVGISPLAEDIDWSLCDENLRRTLMKVASGTGIMTDKDRNGLSLRDWEQREESDLFIHEELARQGAC